MDKQADNGQTQWLDGQPAPIMPPAAYDFLADSLKPTAT